MIIYPSGVYTFNGQIQEEDMQMFWVYSYKGFFHARRRAPSAPRWYWQGGRGCCQADTGHLLLALVQTARGSAADFLRRKRVTTTTALANCSAARARGRTAQAAPLRPCTGAAQGDGVCCAGGHMPPALPGRK